MTDPKPNPFRHGPTRGELWFWLAVSLGCLGLMILVLVINGLPSGPGMIEVIALPGLVVGYLGGRSVKRLIRREHP